MINPLTFDPYLNQNFSYQRYEKINHAKKMKIRKLDPLSFKFQSKSQLSIHNKFQS